MRAQAHTIMMHGVIQSKGGVAILRGSSDDDGRSRLINLTIKETRRFHKWGYHTLRSGIRVGVTRRGGTTPCDQGARGANNCEYQESRV